MSSMASPEVSLERVELHAPEALVRMNPARHDAKRRRVQPVEDLTPLPLPADQFGLLQDLQVLRDGGQGDLEILGQLHHALLPAGEGVEDLPARGIGDGAEHGVHEEIIVKCLLKCQPWADRCTAGPPASPGRIIVRPGWSSSAGRCAPPRAPDIRSGRPECPQRSTTATERTVSGEKDAFEACVPEEGRTEPE